MPRKPLPPPPAAEPPSPPRRRGRPSRQVESAGPALTREAILDCAFGLSRNEKVQDISMVRVATELKVSPGLVHYYLDGRDDLTSGIVNRFFRAVNEATPAPTRDPRHDIEALMRANFRVMLEHPGVVDYLATHNRFRMTQRVREGEVDHGVRAFENLARLTRDAGLTPADAALLGHLLRMFVLSSAQSDTHLQTPGFHKRFFDDTLRRLAPGEFPGLHHSLQAFGELEGARVFDAGLRLLLDGFLPADAKPPPVLTATRP